MQTTDATIRIQSLTSGWTSIGVDYVRGLYADPDSINLTSNTYGSDQASFTLKRDPSVMWPDLLADSPVDVEIGGELVWSGRIKETPTSEGSQQQINVTCEGWQYNLDDDLIVRNWVTLDQSGWQDIRTFPGCPLTLFDTAGNVGAGDNGQIQIGYPENVVWPAGHAVGVILDQGPDPNLWAKRISFDAIKDSGSPSAATMMFCRAMTNVPNVLPALVGGIEGNSWQALVDSYTVSSLTTLSHFEVTITPRYKTTTTNGVTTVAEGAFRYLCFFLYDGTGHTVGTGVTDGVVLSNIKLYGDTSYDFSFRATRAVANAIDTGCSKISSGASRTYSDEIIEANPIVYYRMSSPGPNTREVSLGASAVHLTDWANVTHLQAPLIENDSDESMAFNGTSSWIASGTAGGGAALSVREAVTVELWMKTNTTAAGVRNCISQISTSGTQVAFAVRQVGQAINAYFTQGGVVKQLQTGNILGLIRTHVVFTYDGVNQTIYINGVQQAQTPLTGNIDASGGWISVGATQNASEFWNGWLDEIAVYRRALSAAEVKHHYALGNNNTPWGFDRGPYLGATSFEIPEYAPGANGQRPREIIDAVNAYHAWQFKIDPYRNPAYRPLPSRAKFEVGAWSGAQFQDASANSGADIFTEALVQATQADGSVLLQRQVQATTNFAISDMLQNGSFGVDVNGWDNSLFPTATISRTTTAGEFTSAPAGLKAVSASSTNPIAAVKGNATPGRVFKAGKTYRITLNMRPVASNGLTAVHNIYWGAVNSNDYANTSFGGVPSGTFSTFTLDWTPQRDWRSENVYVQVMLDQSSLGAAATTTVFIDDAQVSVGVDPTIPGRWDENKTAQFPINAKMTPAAASQITTVYLDLHRSAPFRGSLVAQPGGVRNATTGENVHPARLLNETMELMRFAHIIDPDSGGIGRNGRIANVSYTHSTQSASVDIDSTRKGFEALLARVGILQSARANLR